MAEIDPIRTSSHRLLTGVVYNCSRCTPGVAFGMAQQGVQRRLAAILAADVVGYSRLMGADEEGTLVALKARRHDVLQPMVAQHHGRIVKVMGDGVLVEFASAVSAVQCAVDLQE